MAKEHLDDIAALRKERDEVNRQIIELQQTAKALSALIFELELIEHPLSPTPGAGVIFSVTKA